VKVVAKTADAAQRTRTRQTILPMPWECHGERRKSQAQKLSKILHDLSEFDCVENNAIFGTTMTNTSKAHLEDWK
jgi:hypothetical protein